ncbi:unnamed protein product, partial [Amoebophrya sp. A120]|eukprot:GSA120T00013286001.1
MKNFPKLCPAVVVGFSLGDIVNDDEVDFKEYKLTKFNENAVCYEVAYLLYNRGKSAVCQETGPWVQPFLVQNKDTAHPYEKVSFDATTAEMMGHPMGRTM